MPRSRWQLVAKGAAGFVAGLVAWIALSAPYAHVLASLSEPFIRVTEHPAVTRLVPNGVELTIDRSDFPRESPRPGLALMKMTFNFILLITLFAATAKPLSDGNVLRLFTSSLALVGVHVAAVIANVHSIYALQLGAWSDRNYSNVSANFWGAAAHFYALMGGFAASFVLWWMFRSPSAVTEAELARGSPQRRRGRRGYAEPANR